MQKININVYPNTLLVFEYLCNQANIQANRVFVSALIYSLEIEWNMLYICIHVCVYCALHTGTNIKTVQGLNYPVPQLNTALALSVNQSTV